MNLSNPSSGAVLGTPSAAVLTIVNDDKPGVISFSSASYQKSELAQSVTIRATRTGGTASGIFVEYETVAITAGAGIDYVDQRGTLEFSAGQTAAFFSIPFINDAAVEGNETVRLQLRNPSGGATLGSTPDATLTILDDD